LGFVRDHSQIERAEVDHLKRNLAVESSMNRWGGEVNDYADACKGAAALDACGKFEISIEMNALASDGKYMPRMLTKRREDN
jgi:hypothetical protein